MRIDLASTIWLAAFTIGSLVPGLSTQSGLLAAGVALFVFGAIAARSKWPYILIATSALFWGHAHHIGEAPRKTGYAFVIHSEFFGTGTARLVLTDSGSRFVANGAAATGSWGQYHCRSNHALLAKQRCRFATIISREAAIDSPGLVAQTRTWAKARLNAYDADISAWTASLILGEYSQLPQPVVTAFRATGTYHLLIISGMHLTFLAVGMQTLLLGPLQMLYAARAITATTWATARHLLPIANICLVTFYALLTGMPPPVQRALLAFSARQLGWLLCGPGAKRHALLCAACLQTLLYPAGFFSEGSLLSWTAYLLVLGHASRRFSNWRTNVVGAVMLQTKMCLVVALVCEQISWLGIIVNPIANPVSHALMIASLMLFIPGMEAHAVGEFAIWLIRQFVEVICLIGTFGEQVESRFLPNVFQQIPKQLCFKVAAILVFGWVVLNSLNSLATSGLQRAASSKKP